MEDCTSDGAATRPESTSSQDSHRVPEEPEQPKPVLSLVGGSSGEDGFFARGAAEDKAAMELYAAMLPRAHIWGRISPRHLLVAGGVALLLIGGLLGRHLPASKAVRDPAEAGLGVAAATPAPTGPAIPEKGAPAPASAATPAPEVPAIPAAPVAAVLDPSPAEPVAPQPAPSPAPNLAAVPAPAPVPAAPAQDPAAQPASEPEQAAALPARIAEPQSLQGCREAIKRRDVKLVNADCESALAADASLAKPLLAFAKIQFERGKSAQAAVWARKIVQVNDSLADAYLILGVAEQEARHPAAAKTAYQRYLELAPKGPYAEDVRSSLKSL